MELTNRESTCDDTDYLIERECSDAQEYTENGDNKHSLQSFNETISTSLHDTDSLIRSNDPSNQRVEATDGGELSSLVIVAFSVNYVMGTGFLTLPWAFYECGTALGAIVLCFMIVPSLISIYFILEAMARATALTSTQNLLYVADLTRFNSSQVLSRQLPKSLRHQHGELIVGPRKFELTELCDIFMGPTGKLAYTVTIAVFLYGTLWAFSTVFANAFVTHVDFGPAAYYVYLLLFAVIVVPFSCMELKEQMYIQIVLALCRVVMVLFMVGSVSGAFKSDGDPFGAESSTTHSYGSNMIDFSGLHIIFPIAVYANMFHHSVPALSEPAKNKKSLGSTFALTLFCCFFAYTLIGVTLSVYFGENIRSSSNLNWRDYGSFHKGVVPALQKLVSTYVVIFPALDVASAFPLNAITLVNSPLVCVIVAHITSLGNSLYTSALGDDAKNYPRYYLVGFRLLASIPPIIGASVISDLGAITDYTGITGMAVGFIFPALLAFYSEKYFLDKRISPTTVYSSVLTSRKSIFLVLVFGIFLMTFAVISLVVYGSPE